MYKPVAAFLLLCLLAPAAHSAKAPKHFVDAAKLPFAAIPGLATERSWGVLNGAGYRIEVPDDWNGSLVLWAHGFRGTGLELTVDNHPLRAYLVANGYAWAASSYRKNGIDTLGAAKDTHALRSHFIDQFGKPSRIYVTGASLGGQVTTLVAERWPTSYSGAMPICSGFGDPENFDFYLDFNVAAQTLSGVGEQFPFGADYLSTTVPATKAALGPAFPFVLNAAGNNFKALTQLHSGGVRPLFEQGWAFWNGVVSSDFLFGLGIQPGEISVAMQNSDVNYSFDTDPAQSAAEAAFNAAVQRVTADPTARRNMTPTTGDLRIPMLAIHTLGDLFVPFLNQQVYAQRVAARGASDLLVQRATRDVGHCSFSAAELITTFADLITWVNTGTAPVGDDVLDPVAVSDPDFGCAFTDTAAPRIWNSPGSGIPAPAACPAL